MSKYNITLNENRSVSYEVECWGTEYENQATVLKFIFPETISEHETSSFSKYIEFKENTNKKAEEDKAIFYDLLNSDNEYVITSAITFYNSMNVQIVLKKIIDETTGEMVVWKSKIFTMNFCDGINASDIIDPEDPRIDLIETLVTDVREASETVNTLNGIITEAEVTRQANEETRKTNEAERQANEIARQTNENARNLFEKYDATKLYVANNKVAYNGSSYVCIKNLTEAGILPTNEEYWLLIALRGDDATAATTADIVAYNNETSGLSSSSVQDAIDELAGILEEHSTALEEHTTTLENHSTAIENLNTMLDGVEALLASI